MAKLDELSTEEKAERKRQIAIEGAKALAEYQAAIEGEDAKIARLRALRLERDDLAAKAAAKAKTAKPAPKATKKLAKKA